VKSAADTFRPNPDIDVASAITELKIGEALVSLLQPDGAPSPVQRTLIKPPSSRVGPLTDEERKIILTTDNVGTKYDQAIDRESAQEILAGRAAEASTAAAAALQAKEQAAADKLQAKEDATAERERIRLQREQERLAAQRQREAEREEARRAREAAKPTMTDKIIQSATRSAASSIGRSLGTQLLRGILGGLLRGR
jgi:hypothetical protein